MTKRLAHLYFGRYPRHWRLRRTHWLQTGFASSHFNCADQSSPNMLPQFLTTSDLLSWLYKCGTRFAISRICGLPSCSWNSAFAHSLADSGGPFQELIACNPTSVLSTFIVTSIRYEQLARRLGVNIRTRARSRNSARESDLADIPTSKGAAASQLPQWMLGIIFTRSEW